MSGKMERAQLRASFDQVLEHVWERWVDFGVKGTPWGSPDQVIEETSLTSIEMIDFYTDVGWLRGVNQTLGWPLKRPGPREWSPRDPK